MESPKELMPINLDYSQINTLKIRAHRDNTSMYFRVLCTYKSMKGLCVIGDYKTLAVAKEVYNAYKEKFKEQQRIDAEIKKLSFELGQLDWEVNHD